jgi:activating signal cointegrator 1
MKVLTVRQPHAQAIFARLKLYETRSWSTSYRGPLAIHAGLALDTEAIEDLVVDSPRVKRSLGEMRRGVILGVVTLVDVVPTDELPWDRHGWGDWGNFDEGCWAWVIKRPRLFRRPFPATGRLGLWDANVGRR